LVLGIPDLSIGFSARTTQAPARVPRNVPLAVARPAWPARLSLEMIANVLPPAQWAEQRVEERLQ